MSPSTRLPGTSHPSAEVYVSGSPQYTNLHAFQQSRKTIQDDCCDSTTPELRYGRKAQSRFVTTSGGCTDQPQAAFSRFLLRLTPTYLDGRHTLVAVLMEIARFLGLIWLKASCGPLAEESFPLPVYNRNDSQMHPSHRSMKA